MNQFIDYYSVLGISQNATSNEINTAYKTQCLKWHPDRNPRIDTTKKMQEINEAKRILSDKRLRENYNKHYRTFGKASANQATRTTENKNTSYKPNGNYVCDLKTDDELIRICANAAKYNFEFIHAVLQELKKRNYSLDGISRILKQRTNRSV